MLVKGCKALINMSLSGLVQNWLKEIPDHLNAQEMCSEAMCSIPDLSFFIPDHFKAKKICIKAIEEIFIT